MKNNKGFTLIELLVVISIISLLSSIVFTVLGSARVKAKDAAIKQEIAELGKVIEQDFLSGNYSNYGGSGLWVGGFVNPPDCSNLTGNMASEAQKICIAIYNIGVGAFSEGNKILMGAYDPNGGHPIPQGDMYSITVVLNSGNYYCFSNLGVYEGPNPFHNYHPCYWYAP